MKVIDSFCHDDHYDFLTTEGKKLKILEHENQNSITDVKRSFYKFENITRENAITMGFVV